MFDLSGINGDSIQHWVFMAVMIVIVLWRKFTKQDEKQEKAFRFTNPMPSGRLMLALVLAFAVVMASDELYAQYKMSKLWDQNPHMKIIIDDQPERFLDVESYMLMLMKDSYLSEKQVAHLQSLANEMGNTIYMEYLPKTSDTAAVAFSHATLNVLKDLENKNDSEACYSWIYGSMSKIAIMKSLDPNVQKEFRSSVSNVVQQAATNSQAAAKVEDSTEVAIKVSKQLRDTLDRDLLKVNPVNAKTINEKKNACRVVIAFAEKLHEFPSSEISMLIRGQYASQ